MRIGELSQITGCPIGTIRFYESKGLLKSIARNLGGQRIYTSSDLKRLQLIMTYRSNGMKLECIVRVIQFMDNPQLGSEWLLQNVENYLSELQKQRQSLDRAEKYLRQIHKKLTQKHDIR